VARHACPVLFWAMSRMTLVLFATVVLGLGCGTGASLQCRLDAVRFLPSDPGQVTPYDVVDLVGRLKACPASTGDAGS